MDQRQYPRKVVRLPGSFLGEGSVTKGKVFNVSLGGCGVHSAQSLQVGTFIEADLYLPGADLPVKVNVAVVRWVAGKKFGLEFLQIQDNEKICLQEFVGIPKWVQRLKRFLSGNPNRSTT